MKHHDIPLSSDRPFDPDLWNAGVGEWNEIK
jgi:hypothetical protein